MLAKEATRFRSDACVGTKEVAERLSQAPDGSGRDYSRLVSRDGRERSEVRRDRSGGSRHATKRALVTAVSDCAFGGLASDYKGKPWGFGHETKSSNKI
jgi:hypothetical protein